MKDYLKTPQTFLFWAGGLFLALGIIWLLPWRFQTNDDVMMMWLVSGAYTGEPEPYAVFIHPWLSWSFSKIYGLFPETNWYGLTWFAVNFLSAFLLLKKVWISAFTKIQKHFWSLFIGLLSFHFAFFPQFTLIAGLAALAGLLTVFDTKSKGFITLGYVVLLMAFSIRFEAAVLVGLGWAWCAWVFPEVKAGFFISRGLLLISFAVFLAFGKWSYQESFVSLDYLDFNQARPKILDHPVFVQQSQEGTIPDSSDWFLVSRWMFEELSLSTEDFMAKKKESDHQLWTWKAFKDGLIRILRVQQTELFKSMLILVLLLSFLLSDLSWRKKILFFGVWVMFYLLFNHFNLLLGRVNLLFFMTFLFPVFNSSLVKKTSRWIYALIALLCLFLGIHFFNFWKEAKGREQVQQEFFSLLEEKKSDAPVFLEGIMEYIFLKKFSQSQPIPFLSYGWISRSHMQEKAYELRGFSRQSELKEFYLLAFQLPEPLVFPDYMNRISPGFILQSEMKSESLVLLHFVKSKSFSPRP
ncbi:MAG: hypothetical protein HLUCCX10_02530 [Algoriphagus marincola HL-49]|uniref:Glycosyltransferase RgtA/B/C/D-like domain-containing protein n=1 Tax=Algoriphagus marincola HL-49 TaxID=1305737 RepID=A0A0P7XR11_9BACT|nr:MAG: hypothetical protein HLUCCX10_02530 [Algoriphagus marincola HL-49]